MRRTPCAEILDLDLNYTLPLVCVFCRIIIKNHSTLMSLLSLVNHQSNTFFMRNVKIGDRDLFRRGDRTLTIGAAAKLLKLATWLFLAIISCENYEPFMGAEESSGIDSELGSGQVVGGMTWTHLEFKNSTSGRPYSFLGRSGYCL